MPVDSNQLPVDSFESKDRNITGKIVIYLKNQEIWA